MKIQPVLLAVLLLFFCAGLTGPVRAEQKNFSVKPKLLTVKAKTVDSHNSIRHKDKKILTSKLIQKTTDSATVKPLDLSIPFADVDKSDRSTEPSTVSSDQGLNYFASENKKKTRPLQVDGRLLMSPEPEAEKQKSADGAGIVINLKP